MVSSVIKQAGSELKLLPDMQQVSALLFCSAASYRCLLSLMLHLTLKLGLELLLRECFILLTQACPGEDLSLGLRLQTPEGLFPVK